MAYFIFFVQLYVLLSFGVCQIGWYLIIDGLTTG